MADVTMTLSASATIISTNEMPAWCLEVTGFAFRPLNFLLLVFMTSPFSNCRIPERDIRPDRRRCKSKPARWPTYVH